MSNKSSLSSNGSGKDNKAGQKKKGGGYLARQVKSKKGLTEEELAAKENISPEDVLRLTKSTKGKEERKHISLLVFERVPLRDLGERQDLLSTCLFLFAKMEAVNR